MRLVTTAERVSEYLDGKVNDIPELEAEQLPFCKNANEETPYANRHFKWGSLITAGIYI